MSARRKFIRDVYRGYTPDNPMRADEAEELLKTQCACLVFTSCIALAAFSFATGQILASIAQDDAMPTGVRWSVVVALIFVGITVPAAWRYIGVIIALPAHIETNGFAPRPGYEVIDDHAVLRSAMGTDGAID